MFVCPICQREYRTDAAVAKCFLACWKDKNPTHESNSVPKYEETIRNVSNDVADFFAEYQK